MSPFLVRLLIGCLIIWLIDQILVKFSVGEPPARIIQIIVIILAALWILFGWMVPLEL